MTICDSGTRVLISLWTLAALSCVPRLSAAQTPTKPDVGITASVDFLNHYMFRGVRQNSAAMAVWPAVDVHMRHGQFEAHGGFWNSLHTGDTGFGGPAGRVWYESDLYASLGVHFARGVKASTTYTAYRSPNDLFTTVNEIAVKVSVDDASANRALALNPFALAAFEIRAQPGVGQVDGGAHAGRYLELGAAPTHAMRRMTIAVPLKMGLSIGNYYELAGEDHPFGFVSAGVVAAFPIMRAVNVHGGAEYQHLGRTTTAFNSGDTSRTIASIGVGFTYR